MWQTITRKQYQEFDQAARRDGGVGLVLFEWGTNPAGTAGMGFCNRRGVIYDTPTGPVLHPVIEVAKSIPLHELKGSTGPEIKRDAVPADRLHAFIVAHEFGHLLGDVVIVDPELEKNETAQFAVQAYNELRADRLAWHVATGGAPLPYRDGGKEYAAAVEEQIRSLSGSLGKLKHPNGGRPLPNSWRPRHAA